jgi:hypothetical protein
MAGGVSEVESFDPGRHGAIDGGTNPTWLRRGLLRRTTPRDHRDCCQDKAENCGPAVSVSRTHGSIVQTPPEGNLRQVLGCAVRARTGHGLWDRPSRRSMSL